MPKGTIVQSFNGECTMLRHRNPINIYAFTLLKGTIVHAIH